MSGTIDNLKTVLVTGAGKRIGAEIAKNFANQGYRVAVHVNQSTKEGNELITQLQGDAHILLQGDLANTQTPATLIHKAIEVFEHLDCLVCNASVFVEGDIASESTETIHHSIAINLLSPILMTQALWKVSFQERPSSVVLLGDQKIVNLNPDNFSYTISRTALHGCLNYLSMTTAPRLRINMIMPGLTLPSGSQSNENFNKYHNKTALGYGNKITDITEAIRWISENTAITGQIITVDGGQHLFSSDRDVMYKN